MTCVLFGHKNGDERLTDEIEPCLPGLPCDENGIESGESDENGWG